MTRTWLILDANSLCWRAFHSTGGLSYKNTPTGTAYGFLAAVIKLQGEFQTHNTVFCFDRGPSIRARVCKSYKELRNKKRDEATPEEKKKYAQFYRQVKRLRLRWLKRIGFKNVFSQKYYEADDVIASVCKHARFVLEDEAIIVSSDEDMFQLITNRITVYNPNKGTMMTRRRFIKEYGIPPRRWVEVKALAGCSTDEVPGITGVGEKTALRYLRGELKPGSRGYSLIDCKEGRKIKRRNLPLVSLPYEGTKQFIPQPDSRDLGAGWDLVLKELNAPSLNKALKYRERKRT